jgi:hypothetical protein
MIDRYLTIFLGGLVATSFVFGSVTFVRLKTEQAAHSRTQAAHQHMVAALESERAFEEAKRRKAEQELRNATEAHGEEIASLNADLDRARSRSAVESRRMLDTATATAKRASEQCASAASTEVGSPAGDPIGVLADVLGRVDARADLLADLADRRYIAGRACEREYDALQEKLRHTDKGG